MSFSRGFQVGYDAVTDAYDRSRKRKAAAEIEGLDTTGLSDIDAARERARIYTKYQQLDAARNSLLDASTLATQAQQRSQSAEMHPLLLEEMQGKNRLTDLDVDFNRRTLGDRVEGAALANEASRADIGLTRATAARTRTLTPYEAAAMHADTGLSYARIGQVNAQTDETRAMTPWRVRLTAAQTANTQANTQDTLAMLPGKVRQQTAQTDGINADAGLTRARTVGQGITNADQFSDYEETQRVRDRDALLRDISRRAALQTDLSPQERIRWEGAQRAAIVGATEATQWENAAMEQWRVRATDELVTDWAKLPEERRTPDAFLSSYAAIHGEPAARKLEAEFSADELKVTANRLQAMQADLDVAASSGSVQALAKWWDSVNSGTGVKIVRTDSGLELVEFAEDDGRVVRRITGADDADLFVKSLEAIDETGLYNVAALETLRARGAGERAARGEDADIKLKEAQAGKADADRRWLDARPGLEVGKSVSQAIGDAMTMEGTKNLDKIREVGGIVRDAYPPGLVSGAGQQRAPNPQVIAVVRALAASSNPADKKELDAMLAKRPELAPYANR